jgi:hypothetical protein
MTTGGKFSKTDASFKHFFDSVASLKMCECIVEQIKSLWNGSKRNDQSFCSESKNDVGAVLVPRILVENNLAEHHLVDQRGVAQLTIDCSKRS